MTVERSYARKIADLIAFLVPFLLLAGLALGGGGYDLFVRHLAGIAAWVLVAALLIGRWPDPVRVGRSLALVGGLLLSLAMLAAISSIWSSSVSSSLAEFERGIGYLGFFTASYLTMRTPKQREWFARGIGAGIAFILLLALGDRMVSGGGDVVFYDRLAFPLGYWNADGVTFGAGVVLFVWFTSRAGRDRERLLWMAASTLAATGLYLTYSRGGLAVASIAVILLFFFSRDRLKVLGITAITIASSVPVLFTIDRFPAIAGTGSGSPSPAEALAVLLVMAVSIGVAFLIIKWAVRLAASRPESTTRALELSRDRRALFSVAGAGAAILLVLVLAFGGTAWDQFSDSDVPASKDPQARFTQLSGSWRYEFDKLALDTFADHPLLGTGAGTYRFEWTRNRDIYVVTQDAHSFYLESLSDLGLAGGLLTFGLAFSLIWLGIIAWRRGRGREGPVMLAIVIALLVSFAFDWFWRLGATAALLLLFAAWIASAETVDPDRQGQRTGDGVRFAGVLAAWVAIVVLAVPAVANRYVEASADSVIAGNVNKAEDQARTASRLQPWDPEPHMQLATIANSRGSTDQALEEIDRAIELEPDNWQAWQIRFQINYDAGRQSAARRDFEQLREINPLTFGEFSFDQVRERSS